METTSRASVGLSDGVQIHRSPWVHVQIFAIVVVAGYLAPTVKFDGPVRYGYINYSQHFAQVYHLLTNRWTLVVLFLAPSLYVLPFVSLGLVATCLAAWVHVYREYNEHLRQINDDVAEYLAEAAVATVSARAYTATAARYQTEMVSMVAAARRDALLVKTVKATDFFSCATEAWAALGTSTQPAETAREKATELVNVAVEAMQADKPVEEGGRSQALARYLQQTSKDARDRATEVEERLKAAQEAMSTCKEAQKLVEDARMKAKSNATSIAAKAKQLFQILAVIPEGLSAVELGAETTKRFATQAVDAATKGDITAAQMAANTAKTEANKATAATEKLRGAMKSAYDALLGWIGCDVV
ncbi:hypothetical protein BBP40_006681 [Aspergillus hancockii]|nr:hypothetical protein BBP40_006681 [Aspergillus hancockii]